MMEEERKFLLSLPSMVQNSAKGVRGRLFPIYKGKKTEHDSAREEQDKKNHSFPQILGTEQENLSQERWDNTQTTVTKSADGM